jgi:dephospho-CoA kinase
MPLKIGVTGGIGAGKSVVCRIFKVLGAPVYDADIQARWLMNHNKLLKSQLRELLGQDAYLEDGMLNRPLLSKLVFSQPDLLQKVNDLVHPAVGGDFADWLSRQNNPYVVKEAALLFESGSYKALDFLITVTAPVELRIARVLHRDPQRSREQILEIIGRQWPEEEKIKRSHAVVANDETRLMVPEILALHQRFCKQL